jgi:serine/threonine protein kinase
MFVCAECGSKSDRAGLCTSDGTVRTFTDDAFLGMEIGPYRLARLLGRGGMGRVYLGIQPAVGGRVAIKLLSDDACEKPELIERFFTEARAVNLIRHEGIVHVLDFTRLATGRPAIVMELVEGRTLREIIQAGKVPLGGAVQVMIEALAALAAAHDIGIVHRDLKPDNIIVTPGGRAKILDFGVAKLASDIPGAGPKTKTGSMLGTPHYMSPEQIGRGTVDARSDVYAAGVVMFEVVTRRKPFEGLGEFELLRAHVESPPPSPCKLRPELPQALGDVILRALAKQRGDRFASANAMANALHDASAELPESEWRSLAPHGRALTRSPTAPASIPPPTAATGPVARPTRPVRRALPYEVTDRPEPEDVDEDEPRAPQIPDRAEVPADPDVNDRTILKPDASDRAISQPPDDQPAKHPTRPPTEATRPSTTEPTAARRWRRVIVPVIAACTGGAVVALVIHLTAPAPQPPSSRSIPPIAATGELPHAVPGSSAVAAPVLPSPGDGSSATAAADLASSGDGSSASATAAALAAGPEPRRLEQSINFDPRHFDPSAYFVTAQALARKLLPDAALTVMTFRSVLSSGLVDFEFAGLGDVTYTFRSPSRSIRPPGVPRNAPFQSACMVMVEVSEETVSAVTGTVGCDDDIVPPPRCTTADVWKVAIADGMAADRLATIQWAVDARLVAGDKRAARWLFSTVAATQGIKGAAMATYPDCAGATPNKPARRTSP